MKKALFLALLLVLSVGIVAAQDEAVTLRLWAHQEEGFNDATMVIAEQYMAEHPNVTIEMETFEYDLYLQTLQTALPAGDEADILALFGSWTCSYADHLAPMPEGLVDTSIFFNAAITGYTCDDVVYGLPQEFNLEYGAVLVGADQFAAAGVTYPPAWGSWEDFAADAAALSQYDENGQMTVAGYHFTNADAIVFSFLAGILQNGGQYLTEDGFTFDTPEARATLEAMKSLADNGAVDAVLFNDTANWGGDAFFTNQSAMTLIGPWAVAYGLGDFPDFGDFEYVELPSFTGGDPLFAADSGWGLNVSANSPHSDIAWDFIQYAAANADNALGWNIATGTIPALQVLTEDAMYSEPLLEASPWLAAVLPNLGYGQYIGDMPDRDLVFYDIIYPTILEVLQGSLSVDDALLFIDDDANSTFE